MAWRARLVIVWTFGVTMTPTIVDAQSNREESFCDIVSAQFDNDEMGGSDRHYTSGIRLACTTSPPPFLNDIVASYGDPGAITNSWSTYSIGLNMFTSDDLSRSEPIEDDQSCAGWLHLGFGSERETAPRDDRPRFLDTFELQLGVIGPLSGAEQVQRFGLAITYGDIHFGYTHVFRSREFEGQDPQDFGSISLSVRF